MDTESRPLLFKLPMELLLQVTSHLTTPELGNFRRTCKYIEASLLKSFSLEFFTKRQFMLTEFSLQALIDISMSRFAPSLTQVILSVERPRMHGYPPIHEMDVSEMSPERRAMQSRVAQEVTSQTTLINTGHDVEMLSQAFGNLVNLECVGLRDFNSRSRHRDSPNIAWRSYGATSVERETGQRLETTYIADDEDRYRSRLFSSMLLALGRSSSRPKRFEIILRHGGLIDHAFHIPKYIEPTVQPVLDCIGTLFVDFRQERRFALLEADAGTFKVCSTLLLRRFLSRLPHLEHLRLNYHSGGGGQREAEDLFRWLSKCPSAAETTSKNTSASFIELPRPLSFPPPPVNFPKLQQLDIGMVMMEPQVLLAVFEKLKTTLRDISLHKVSLTEPDGLEADDKPNVWSQFFSLMPKTGLSLNGMNVSHPSLQRKGNLARRVWFDTKSDTTKYLHKSWSGQDFDGACKDFADAVSLDSPFKSLCYGQSDPLSVLGDSSEEDDPEVDVSDEDDDASDDDSDGSMLE